MYSSILTAADQFSSTLVFCAWELLIKLPKPVEGGEKAAALLTPFFDEEVATRLAGEETEPEIRKKDMSSQCLKITEKVLFNIASEASYVYILSGQKLIKNAKNGPVWRVFENLKLAVKQCYQTGQF